MPSATPRRITSSSSRDSPSTASSSTPASPPTAPPQQEPYPWRSGPELIQRNLEAREQRRPEDAAWSVDAERLVVVADQLQSLQRPRDGVECPTMRDSGRRVAPLLDAEID